MNATKIIKCSTQLEFQSQVAKVAGDRTEFIRNKARVYTHGNPKPQKFKWVHA